MYHNEILCGGVQYVPVHTVLHHKGFRYDTQNINTLLEQRHVSAQFRKSGGRTKGPAPFTNQDIKVFESKFITTFSKLCADMALF